jgi:hypothetical protein
VSDKNHHWRLRHISLWPNSVESNRQSRHRKCVHFLSDNVISQIHLHVPVLTKISPKFIESFVILPKTSFRKRIIVKGFHLTFVEKAVTIWFSFQLILLFTSCCNQNRCIFYNPSRCRTEVFMYNTTEPAQKLKRSSSLGTVDFPSLRIGSHQYVCINPLPFAITLSERSVIQWL